MSDVKQLFRIMTITGFILFVLGLVTMTPEIYFSGIMVMFLATTLQLKELEKQRGNDTSLEDNAYFDYNYHLS